MNLNISDEYFGELLPFIKDETVTDITWNGRDLWLDDLDKGRYKSSVKLSDNFVSTFSTRIANLANKNFNLSEPLLEAETDDLRISVIDGTVTNTNRSIAIRKTPAVRRLNELKMLDDSYAEALVLKLFEGLVKGHCSTIVTGDVGSGKTEFVKYLTKFIPNYERTISIEDNYELRLSAINPSLDCVEIKASQDGPFSYQMAIKAALRQLCKWLLMAEARSKEVLNLLEAASTGCIVMTTLHSDDVRKIPDRVVNMMGMEGEEKRNDVYNFFDIGVKIGIEKTEKGIHRSVDQICVLDRDNDINTLYLIYNKGFTGQTLPNNVWAKLVAGSKEDIHLFEFLKPDNADSDYVNTPEFTEMATELEDSMKEELLEEKAEQERLSTRYGASNIDDIDDLIKGGFFRDEKFDVPQSVIEAATDEDIDKLIGIGVFDDDWIVPENEDEADEIVSTLDLDEIENLLDNDSQLTFLKIDQEEEQEEDLLDVPDFDFKDFNWEEELADIQFDTEPKDLEKLLGQLANIEEDESMHALKQMANELNLTDIENLTKEELIAKLREHIITLWVNNLTDDETIAELTREIMLVEACNEAGTDIPAYDMAKIQVMMRKKRA